MAILGMRDVDCSQMYKVRTPSFGHPIWTTVTSNPTCVSRWISDLKSYFPVEQLVVGFHAEWCPYGEEKRMAVMELCTGNVCLIFQILHSPCIPPALSDFLSDELYSFVGVGVEEDLMRLQEEYGIGGQARWEEVGELAARASGMDGYKREGLESLASSVLNIEMEKPPPVSVDHGMSWWDNRFLSCNQIKYATQHAFLSFLTAWALITDTRYY